MLELDDLSLKATVPVDGWYSFPLAAGQSATVALAAAAPGADLQLYNASQQLLAQGVAGSNVAEAINGFVAPAAGTYYVRVSGSGTTYSLIVTRGADFPAQANSTLASAENLSGGSVLGCLSSTTASGYYRFFANAGDALVIGTQTPSSGPNQFSNSLLPGITLYDPSGKLVAIDANGNTNPLTYSATVGGAYTVCVFSAAGSGEYVLSVQGASGSRPSLAVAATTPVSGSLLYSAPTTFTVAFSDFVAAASLSNADLLIDGVADSSATPPALVDGRTAVFTLPPGLADGTYSVAFAAGAIEDVHGLPLQAFSGSFIIDTDVPRVIASSIHEGDVVSVGTLVYTATFSEDMNAASLNAAGFALVGATTGAHAAASFAWIDPRALQVVFDNVPLDSYTLTLYAGEFEDVAGNALDGDPHWPFSLPSGDDQPGGNFFVHFTAQKTFSAAVSLNTHAPGTNDVLTATASKYDPNGTPVALTFAWAVNGTVMRTFTSATALSDTFDLSQPGNGNRGDTITVAVTPSEMGFNGTPVADAAIVADTPPTAAVTLSSHLLPADAVVTATATASDADGDPVTLTYVWKVNGIVKRTFVSTALSDTFDLSAAGNCNPGDTITVEVTPNDGFVDGATVSDSATVESSPSWAISDPAGSDVIRIACNNANPSMADVFFGSLSTTPAYSTALATFSQWQVSTGNGNDQLVVDFTHGNPLPVGGLVYDGGTGTNTLCILDPAGENATVSSTQVTLGANVIICSNVENFSFNLARAN